MIGTLTLFFLRHPKLATVLVSIILVIVFPIMLGLLVWSIGPLRDAIFFAWGSHVTMLILLFISFSLAKYWNKNVPLEPPPL